MLLSVVEREPVLPAYWSSTFRRHVVPSSASTVQRGSLLGLLEPWRLRPSSPLWRFHCRVSEVSSPLGDNAISSNERLPRFRKNLVHSSSRVRPFDTQRWRHCLSSNHWEPQPQRHISEDPELWTESFITVFTKASNWWVPWVTWVHSTPCLKTTEDAQNSYCGMTQPFLQAIRKPPALKLFRMYPSLRLTLRRLMSYIYGAPILDVSRSHTTTQHSR